MTYPITQVDPEPDPQPQTLLEVQPHSRHRRRWHQDPGVRTWLLPPVVGAGLGVIFGLGQFIVSFVRSVFVFSADVPNLLNVPFDCFAYACLGVQAGLLVSCLIQFCKLPQKQRHTILKGLGKGAYALVLLFAVLMSFGLLSGMLGTLWNRRL